MQEKMLTPKEAATVMGISYRAMLDLMPEMPCLMVGKRRFLTEALIRQWQMTSACIPSQQRKKKTPRKTPMAELMKQGLVDERGRIRRMPYGHQAAQK